MWKICCALLLGLAASLLAAGTAYQFLTTGLLYPLNLSLDMWQGLAAIVYGLFGLPAGLYYIHARVEQDRQAKRDERQRERLTYLLDRLTQAHELALDILGGRLGSAADLAAVRARLNALVNSVADYMEVHLDFLDLDDEQRKAILKVHSYIERKASISRLDLPQLSAADLALDRQEFIECSRAARTTCIEAVEAI